MILGPFLFVPESEPSLAVYLGENMVIHILSLCCPFCQQIRIVCVSLAKKLYTLRRKRTLFSWTYFTPFLRHVSPKKAIYVQRMAINGNLITTKHQRITLEHFIAYIFHWFRYYSLLKMPQTKVLWNFNTLNRQLHQNIIKFQIQSSDTSVLLVSTWLIYR